MLSLRAGLAVAVLTAAACVSDPPGLPVASTIGDTGDAGDAELPDPDSGGAWDPADEAGSDSGGSDDGGLPGDLPESEDCDIYAQDCLAGEKCMPVALEGSNAWNATRCRPIDPAPAPVGDPCVVIDGATSGVDTCDAGAMCWNVDETSTGTCIALCGGTSADPTCPDPATTCVVADGNGVLPVCLPVCTPLDPAGCGAGQGCYPVDSGFVCVPDASGNGGAPGDGCAAINACDPGAICISAEANPDCNGNLGCCAALCASDGDCATGEVCILLTDGMNMDPNLDGVGVCLPP